MIFSVLRFLTDEFVLNHFPLPFLIIVTIFLFLCVCRVFTYWLE